MMPKFFASLVQNLAAGALGFLPAAIAYLQTGPQGGALAYVNAHPWAAVGWTVLTYAVSMASRDALKVVPPFAVATLNPLIKPEAILPISPTGVITKP